MAHNILKPTKEIKIDFDPSELDKIEVPEESKKVAREFIKSKKLTDEFDIMMILDNTVIYGYDYLHKGQKLVLPEINPVTIFYSNAVMSMRKLAELRLNLLEQAHEAGKIGKGLNMSHSGNYFQLSINCIINLQATLETFANQVIPDDYIFLDKTGKIILPSVTHKLYNTIPKIKKIDFRQAKFKKHNKSIDALIQLRNDIIHLKPTPGTNSGYKNIYRELLNFDFQRAIAAVKTFVNFYQDNLIEECACGINFNYGIES